MRAKSGGRAFALESRSSITNWRFALVCWQDPARLPTASEALAGASATGGCLGLRQKSAGIAVWRKSGIRTLKPVVNT